MCLQGHSHGSPLRDSPEKSICGQCLLELEQFGVLRWKRNLVEGSECISPEDGNVLGELVGLNSVLESEELRFQIPHPPGARPEMQLSLKQLCAQGPFVHTLGRG